MKSLFLRVFVSLWLTLALLTGIFAVVHALTFPTEVRPYYRKSATRTATLRATIALDCLRDRGENCGEGLAPMDSRDSTITVYREGVHVLGPVVDGVADLEAISRESGAVSARSEETRELLAVVLDRSGDGRYVATFAQRKPPMWSVYLGRETLAYRLIAIVVVAGAISMLMARFLSRPIRTLRSAARELAEGDLSVRVTPKLTAADSETLALGAELDRMAERIEALIEGQRRLLRDVSHELRSPLARLNIALELLRRKSPPESKDALDRIEREASRLDVMIGELLTLSRLDAGGAIEKHEVDLTTLVEKIADDVGFEATEHGAAVEVDIGAEELLLQANEELLHRMIENVLRNAIRFTERGTAVSVKLRREREQIHLTIRDHGPGVPETALESIFEPFYRVEEHRARKAGGTGIGLAIARRAAVAHGGTLTAENAPDGGLRIHLALPDASSVAIDSAA